MQWLLKNWDKWLFPILGIVISGVVGFYAGIISINSSISALAQRTTVLETEMTSSVQPKLSVLDKTAASVLGLTRDVNTLQKQTDLSVQTNKLLDLRIEQERQNTISELRKLLNKQHNP